MKLDEEESKSSPELANDNFQQLTDNDDQSRNNQELNNETLFRYQNHYRSFESGRLELSKLVHRIAPELSCFTGRGEFYRGNVSSSDDNRVCLNWLHVATSSNVTQFDSQLAKEFDHNHCRNRNGELASPWCYVRYLHELDGLSWRIKADGKQSASQYVRRACSVAPCSEYLWLYIVAPPSGVFLLLLLLALIVVRAVRKSHYNSMLLTSTSSSSSSSTKQTRRPFMRFNRFLSSKSRRFAANNCVASKSCANYLNEDIFEIFEDSSWSSQIQPEPESSSSKSCQSFKLDLPAKSRINQKLTSPTIVDRLGSNSATANRNRINQVRSNHNADSITQVGPVFATLRCHLRDRLTSNQFGSRSRVGNKSSTFIEQLADCKATSWSANSDESATPTVQTSPSSATNTHLISCSTTSDSLVNNDERSVRVSDLPCLSAGSLIRASGLQTIYEGKFSQVQLVYMKHPNASADKSSNTQIGSQVALHGLKSVELSVDFRPSSLQVRNLNHLNILKLIGFWQSNCVVPDSECSLVYDMNQLVDLTEWIQQQNKNCQAGQDASAESGLRRNLSCFAKQIALALDYLHDREIIFKDLACRNCFLDPTKMLVKLATFNLELQLSQTDEKSQNLRSMIRPKYLLDYYVIDSRPTDSQLLPLSWIPLESILFNKFNTQTDVWSFGCLLYELFSLGEVAFFGYSSKQVIDAVRCNLKPPQPLLCSSGIYSLMCKCLSDIPSLRPNVKQIYEQLNLFSGQCSSFLDHHLCSVAICAHDESLQVSNQLSAHSSSSSTTNSITKTKSYANIRSFNRPVEPSNGQSNRNCNQLDANTSRSEMCNKIPQSKSINLGANRLVSACTRSTNDANQYDEPVVSERSSKLEATS